MTLMEPEGLPRVRISRTGEVNQTDQSAHERTEEGDRAHEARHPDDERGDAEAIPGAPGEEDGRQRRVRRLVYACFFRPM